MGEEHASYCANLNRGDKPLEQIVTNLNHRVFQTGHVSLL